MARRRGISLPLPPIFEIIPVGQSLAKGNCQTGGNACGSPLSTVQYKSNQASSPTTEGGGTPGTSFVALVAGALPGDECPVVGLINQITFESAGQGWFGVANANDIVAGADYASLKKGTSAYNAMVTAHGNAPAAATSGSFAFGGAAAIQIVHGEQDFSVNNLSAAAYAADIAEWQANIQADVTSSAPAFVSQMSSWWTGYGGVAPTTSFAANGPRGVPLGQLDAARANPGVIYFAGPKYQFLISVAPHYTIAAYLQMGERDGHAIKTVLLDGKYWTGVQPRSLTISGATITARYWVQVAPLVIDTTIVSDRGTGKGFEYWDDSGSPPAISSVSVSGDTVTITLASTPSGFTQQRLRYAYTAPGNPQSGLGARGNLRDSDPAVGRLSGAPLYSWAAHSDDQLPFTQNFPTASNVGGPSSWAGNSVLR
jgi:hypothetical protein